MTNKKLKFFLFLFYITIGLLLLVFPVFALEINYPQLPGAQPPQEFLQTAPLEQHLSLYVLYFFNLIIWIAGIIALGALIYAGILYLTSTGKPEKVLAAREQITQAFLGIIILLSSYLILNILNPQLTTVQLPKLEPPKFIERPEIPAPEVKPLISSIDAELPLGRIIEERIFETSRMTRIKENSKTTLEIAQKLKESNEDLKSEVKKCKCKNAKPVCGKLKFANPAKNFPGLINTLTTVGLAPKQAASFVNSAGQISFSASDSLSFQQTLQEMGNLAQIVNAPGELSNVLNTASNLTNFVRNPEDLTSILGQAGDLANLIQDPQMLKNVLDVLQNTASAIGNPEKLGDILWQNQTQILNIVGKDKLSDVINLTKEASKFIENPQDLIKVFETTNTLNELVNNSEDFKKVLSSFNDIITAVQYTDDLTKILEINKDLSQKIKTLTITEPQIFENTLNQIISLAKEAAQNTTYPEDFKEELEKILVREQQKLLSEGFDLTPEEQNLLNILEEGFNIIEKLPEIGNFSTSEEVLLSLEGMGKLIQTAATPEELTEIIEIAAKIENVKATAQEITQTFETLQELSNKIKNTQSLSDFLNIGADSLKIVGLPAEMDRILAEIGDLTKIIQNPEDIKKVMGIAQEVANIAKSPEDFQRLLSGEISQLTAIVGLENLPKVLDTLKETANFVENTKDLANILNSAGNLAEIIKNPQDITNVLNNISGLSNLVGNYYDLGNIAGSVNNLFNIVQSPQNLTQALGSLQNIGSIIGMPAELGQVLGIGQNLLGITGNLSTFTQALGSFGSFMSALFPVATPLMLSSLFVDFSCISGLPCTCDPCKNVRGDIEKIEQQENLPRIEELKAENIKTIEETKQLKFELGKLERLEDLMRGCPLPLLESLASFFSKTVLFKDQDWILRKIKVWDEINIVYYSDKLKQKVYDWATFYCSVGGTFREKLLSAATAEVPTEEIPTGETPEEVLSLACKSEAPIGEIIDRTKRTTKLLIAKLETLNDFQGEMISAVDKMHVLVSQCTSQRCTSICITILKKCVKRCVGTPCPFGKISKQAEKIREIQEKIDKLVNETKKEEMGIIPIIDKVVAKILEDLNKEIRKTMSLCVSETIEETTGFLGSCDITIGGISPYKLCCDEQIKEFQECLEACYLEEGHQKYRACLRDCLEKKPGSIKWCQHYLNFYCCHPQEEE